MVASLEAPDEFLKNRVMNLPESVVAGTHNTEEGKPCHVKGLSVFQTVSSLLLDEVVSLSEASGLMLCLCVSRFDEAVG